MPVGSAARQPASPRSLRSRVLVLAALAAATVTVAAVSPEFSGVAQVGALLSSLLLAGAVLAVARADKHRPAGDRRHRSQVITAAALVLAAGGVAAGVAGGGDQASTAAGVLLPLGVLSAGLAALSHRLFAASVAGVAGAWTLASALTEPPLAGVSLAASAGGSAVLALAAHLQTSRTAAELARSEARADALGVRDALTGAYNAHGLTLLAGQILATARRRSDAVHCIVVDVTRLRHVNDRLGSGAGDEVLVAVAEALQRSVRDTDVVARTGGDEFCVVGPGSGVHPVHLERRVTRYLKAQPPVDLRVWAPRVRVGSSRLAPWDDGDLQALVNAAEQQLRVVQRSGAPA